MHSNVPRLRAAGNLNPAAAESVELAEEKYWSLEVWGRLTPATKEYKTLNFPV